MDVSVIEPAKNYLLRQIEFKPPKRISKRLSQAHLFGKTDKNRIFTKCLTFENERLFLQIYPEEMPKILFL